MNTYKRLTAALLALIMLLSLTACDFIDSLALPEQSPTVPATTAEPQTFTVTDSSLLGETTYTLPEETPEPTAQVQQTDAFITVGINEVMSSNKASAPGPAGDYPDWVELYNYGSSDVDLSGYLLCCGDAESPLDGYTIKAGEYLVVWCSDANVGCTASLSLSKSGCKVSLKGVYGTVIESMECPEAEADCSFIRDDSGSVVSTSFPSPGYENGTAGYTAFQQSLTLTSPLIINEAMYYNSSYLRYGNSCYDWVELKNISSESVTLSDYSLTDKIGGVNTCVLPDVTLAPGGLYIVYCTGESDLYFTNGANAAFSLSADGDRVFLLKNDTVVDALSLHDIPYNGSMGRLDGQNGSFIFSTPTPNADNSGGYRVYSDTPVLSGKDGIYNDVESVTVTLSAPGTIYYTTNGSAPSTSSNVYSGPFEVSKTTAVRAIAVENGKLPSRELALSYIINENHVLPVVSLMADYSDLLGGAGVYNNPQSELECRGVINFYEAGGSFSKACGIKLHGETSKFAQGKKSMKITFRSRYDGTLEYDLFGNGVTSFSSILLRAAQEDYYSTLMRDNLMHQIAIDTFPELPAQDSNYAVLYINGEYWGLYNIREAFSEYYYEQHYGVDADRVEHWKGKWPADSDAQSLFNFILNYDMSDPDNYAYVCEHLNVDSVIGWAIIQAYSGNFDLNPSNMRFFYSHVDGKLTYVLVDLDLGFFSYNMFDGVFNTDYNYNTLAYRLLKSPEFRERMLSEMQRALTTTMSNESVLERIDEIEAYLTPEISRDRARWGSDLTKWQYMVGELRAFVNNNIGRARLLVNSIKNKMGLDNATVDKYFSEVTALEK